MSAERIKIRWSILVPLILVAVIGGFYVYSLAGMRVCRPSAQYEREQRVLNALQRGLPRRDAELLLDAGFARVTSDADSAVFTSRIDLPRECQRYPVMINVVTVTFEDDRVAELESHDAASWPMIETMIREH